MQPKTITLIVIGVLFLIILIQNMQITTLNIFFWKIHVASLVLLFVILGIGFIAGYLVRSLKKKNKKETQATV
ncbi:hypothetical protein A2V82_13575 [candidate division KSB1 bacterium RBG_16_48_16]|nr:MAG: hypothetical protein A2V82_13575 [candidate division KSB1 bacterium RBG_16_48_16]